MYNDTFKLKYTTIPFATHSGVYIGENIRQNIDRLAHQHREIEILAILKGRAKMHIETECFDVCEGDVVIIPPYYMHWATILKGTDFMHYCLCFDLDLIYDKELGAGLENGEITFSPFVVKNKSKSQKLSVCIKNAFEADKTKNDGWELEVIGNISLFFGEAKKEGIISRNIAAKNDFCHEVFKYIDKNYKENITSRLLAEHLYMNINYFCRKFRKHFGYCFTDYLCIHRIEKSKALLRSTQMPISEVAARVGFNSFSYYSKMFREYVKMTPSEYRRKNGDVKKSGMYKGDSMALLQPDY